jgi:hypothetical protein
MVKFQVEGLQGRTGQGSAAILPGVRFRLPLSTAPGAWRPRSRSDLEVLDLGFIILLLAPAAPPI